MPGAGPAIHQLVEPPGDPDRIYATSSAGLLVSEDRGLTWEIRNRAFAGHLWWETLTVSPIDPDLLLVAPYYEPIHRSTDGGATWEPVPGPPAGEFVYDPVFARSCGVTVYAATEDGAWRSLDGGLYFTEVLSGLLALGGYGWDLEVDPHDPQHVYFQVWYLGLYESENAGDSWTVHPFPAGSTGGLSFAIDSDDGERLAIGDLAAVYTSSDGGESWSGPSQGLESWIDAVAFDPLLPDRMYAGQRLAGLAVSDDAGQTWSAIDDPGLERAGNMPMTILASAHDPALLFAGDQGGVFRSPDRGLSFARSNAGLETSACVLDVAADPFVPARLVAKTGGSAYFSDDSGASWTESAAGAGFFSFDLLADPHVQGRYFAAGWDGRFWRSDDAGASFQVSSPAPALDVAHLVLHPTVPGRLFATTTGSGLWRSDDAGASWTQTSAPVGWCWGIAISSLDPQEMLCDNSYATFRSSDGGASWSPTAEWPGAIVREFAYDPSQAERVYAAVPGHALSRSDDGGEHWIALAEALGDADQVHFLAALPGVVVTNDVDSPVAHISAAAGNGAWLLGKGLLTPATSFADGPGRIYAGTLGSGVQVLE